MSGWNELFDQPADDKGPVAISELRPDALTGHAERRPTNVLMQLARYLQRIAACVPELLQ
jgi:hypothetical protein